MTDAIRTAPTAPGTGLSEGEIDRRTRWIVESREGPGSFVQHNGHVTHNGFYAASFPYREKAQALSKFYGGRVMQVQEVLCEVTP